VSGAETFLGGVDLGLVRHRVHWFHHTHPTKYVNSATKKKPPLGSPRLLPGVTRLGDLGRIVGAGGVAETPVDDLQERASLAHRAGGDPASPETPDRILHFPVRLTQIPELRPRDDTQLRAMTYAASAFSTLIKYVIRFSAPSA
jgi:hypothetical protein